MEIKILLLLSLLILTFGCSSDQAQENNSTYGNDDLSSEQIPTESSEEQAFQEIKGEGGFWSKEDYPELMQEGIVKIEQYRGWHTYEDVSGLRILTEIFQEDKDIIAKQFFRFEIDRVYFTDNTSIFYLYSIDGFLYYFYDDFVVSLDDSGIRGGDIIGPVSFSISGSPNEPHKIGSVEEDGNYQLFLNPTYYTDDFCIETISADGQDKSICFNGQVIGGGTFKDCQGFVISDGAFESASSCLVYVNEDGSMTGEAYDYDLYEDDEEFSTRYTREKWGVYPLDNFKYDDEVLDEYSSEEDSNFDSWLTSL